MFVLRSYALSMRLKAKKNGK